MKAPCFSIVAPRLPSLSIGSVTLVAGLAMSSAQALAQVPANDVIALGAQGQPGAPAAFLRLATPTDSGWLAECLVNPNSGLSFRGFYGVLFDGDPQGPRMLRVPGTFQGRVQQAIKDPSLAGGRVAYLADVERAGGLIQTAWYDDDLIAEVGGPAGSTAGVWDSVDAVYAATDQTVVIEGQVQFPGGARQAFIEYPNGSIILEEGQMVVGSSDTLSSFDSFCRSLDGQHHVVSAELNGAGLRAVLADGAVVHSSAGQLAIEGESLATWLGTGMGTWTGFRTVLVNNAGDVAFDASYETPGGDVIDAVVRNGRVVGPEWEPVDPRFRLASMDERGFLLHRSPFNFFTPTSSFESEGLTTAGAVVDFDGDGDLDPQYEVSGSVLLNSTSVMTGRGAVYHIAAISGPGLVVGSSNAVLRSRELARDGRYCPGEPNSTGRSARLASLGLDVAAYNRMSLRALELPPLTYALPHFSLTPGQGVQPPGSAGTLCLAGNIGRGQSFSMLFSDNSGTATREIFLNQIPQLGGAVSVLPGQTWYCQLWYRDSLQGVPASNFSDAIQIAFR